MIEGLRQLLQLRTPVTTGSPVKEESPSSVNGGQPVDLGNLTAASPRIRVIDVEISSPCAVRSTAPWLLVEPSFFADTGRQQLQLMLDADSLLPGVLLEASVDLQMSSGSRIIRVYGSVDESWSDTTQKSVLLDQTPWTLVKRLQVHQLKVRCLAFTAYGKSLVSGSDDCTVRWWNLADGCASEHFEEYASEVWSLGASRDGRFLAVGLRTGHIILYDAATQVELWERQVHHGFVSGLVFSTDGSVLIASSGDGSISFTSVVSGKPANAALSHPGVATSAALSGSGLLLATTSQTKKVFLWDLAQHEMLRELLGHTQNVWSVAFSLDGYKLASGSSDKTVRIWDASTGQLERQLTGFGAQVLAVAVSPDGRMIATASGEPKTRVWDARSAQRLASLECGTKWISNLAFSPDGQLLAGASYDASVYLWRVGDIPPLG